MMLKTSFCSENCHCLRLLVTEYLKLPVGFLSAADRSGKGGGGYAALEIYVCFLACVVKNQHV